MNRDEPLYSISIAAKLCGVDPQTLRLYERQGLVKPARVAEKNRVYSQADIERLLRIQRLTQDLGVNLAGVEVILRLIDDMDRMQQEFDEEFAEIQREMEKRLAAILKNNKVPVPADEPFRILRFRPEKRKIDL